MSTEICFHDARAVTVRKCIHIVGKQKDKAGSCAHAPSHVLTHLQALQGLELQDGGHLCLHLRNALCLP